MLRALRSHSRAGRLPYAGCRNEGRAGGVGIGFFWKEEAGCSLAYGRSGVGVLAWVEDCCLTTCRVDEFLVLRRSVVAELDGRGLVSLAASK